MRFDLHVHTTASSCSNLTLEDIINHAGERGLDGVCITDHRNGDVKTIFESEIRIDGLCVIFGMEYATADGDFLIFSPVENIPPGLSAVSLLQQVNQHNGVVIAAHPFRKSRPVSEFVVRDGLCRLIEGVNGGNNDIENLQVESWCRQYNLTQTGGSDAHNLNELGRVVTRFPIPVCSRRDLIYALQNGLCNPEWNNSNKALRA